MTEGGIQAIQTRLILHTNEELTGRTVICTFKPIAARHGNHAARCEMELR